MTALNTTDAHALVTLAQRMGIPTDDAIRQAERILTTPTARARPKLRPTRRARPSASAVPSREVAAVGRR